MASVNDFVIANGILKKYKGNGGEVIIPARVKSVGSNAFEGCIKITSVIIPEGIVVIGNKAFKDCVNLTNIEIPESVTFIGAEAFNGTALYNDENRWENGILYFGNHLNSAKKDFSGVCIIKEGTRYIDTTAFVDCASLTDVKIPESVTSIGVGAFGKCVSLTSITIPEGVSKIGGSAFRGCKNLENITIPNSVKTIGGKAVEETAFYEKETNWENGVLYIGGYLIRGQNSLEGNCEIKSGTHCISDEAFSDCIHMTNVTIPEGIIHISKKAFSGCSNLKKISIPDSVTFIDSEAFSNCNNLSNVTIPENITRIGKKAFSGCSSLKDVVIPGGVKYIESEEFAGCANLTSVTISEGVTSIGNNAFYGCERLVNVTIPKTVLSIGYEAFRNCSKLTKVTILGLLETVESRAFSNCGDVDFVCAVPQNVDLYSEPDFFIEKDVLKRYNGPGGEVVVPSGVKSIGVKAFDYRLGVTKVVLPEGVKRISSAAFRDCISLTSITIPDTVTIIGADAFRGCQSLTSLYIQDIEAWCKISFGNCYSSPFYEAGIWSKRHKPSAGNLYLNKQFVSNLIIPDGVACVSDYAFNNCGNLTSVTIPSSLRRIGDEAFASCDNLKAVYINDIIAWCNCDSHSTILSYNGGDMYLKGELLTKLTIPDNVTSVGSFAFSHCNSLVSVMIPDNVISIGAFAFKRCSNLSSVTIPDSVTSIGEWAFHRCNSLTNVEIPESVTRIGNNAFSECNSLMSVSISSNVACSGSEESAFWRCKIAVSVKQWSPDISKILSEADITCIHTEDITLVPVNMRRLAGLGFALEENQVLTSERAKAHVSYLKRNSVSLSELFLAHPKALCFLCEQKLISAKDIDIWIEEADKKNNLEMKAMLLDYQNTLGNEVVSKAREKKEKKKVDYSDALAERIAARDPANGIEGMTFVITGKLSNAWESRSEVKEWLECNGAKLGSSITSKTDYLVTNDMDSGSEKNKKAKEFGVLIINETEFNKMVWRPAKGVLQLTIPKTIRSLPVGVFKDCSRLAGITVEEENKYYCDLDGVLFSKDKTELICVPRGRQGDYWIPTGVTKIHDWAFYGCSGLEKIIIPESVTNIGKGAFSDCIGLLGLTIPENVTSIEDEVFSGCKKMNNITIPDGVKNIGMFAFKGCKGLTSLIIPARVGSIGDQAFSGCENLRSVTIPESVTSIGVGAFTNCNCLKSLMIPSGVLHIGRRAFSNCNNLKSISVNIENQHYCDLDGALFSKDGKELVCFPRGRQGSFSIPDGVTSISSMLFYNCNGLISVTIPESVTSIESSAFSNCSNLTSVIIPKNVTSINMGAFSECSNLTSVTISVGVTSIERYAFLRCSNLTSVMIPKSVTSIDVYAFLDCPKLSIHAPADSYACKFAKKQGIPFVAELG